MLRLLIYIPLPLLDNLPYFLTTMSYRPSAVHSLSGRIALVTGGGTGIGLQITHGLAAAGAKVYITGRRLEVLQKIADNWGQHESNKEGGEIIPIQMDVTNKESIQQGKRFVEEKEGKLHALFNNAGQVGPVSKFMSKDNTVPERKDAETLGQALFHNESFEEWSDLYKINTFSVFFVTSAFLGLLDKGSKDDADWGAVVVNTTSISGVIKVAQEHFCYNSGKAATSHLTRLLSTEFALKGLNIKVNAIAPGVWASEMTIDTITPEVVDLIGKGTMPVPAKRGGTGQEMGGTAVYLASRAGGYMNGQELIIDGGYVAVNPSTI